jgi:nucleoside-diphosphate-sugar epimerase
MHTSVYPFSLSRFVDAVETSGSTFLITGATGLIGSCMVDLLMKANEMKIHPNRVLAMGRSTCKLKQRFEGYLTSPYFTVIEQDIRNPWNPIPEVDYLIHAASFSDPVSYAKYPVETLLTIVDGTRQVLEYGRQHAGCRIVFLSSYLVYGDVVSEIYTEDKTGLIDFTKIRSCYPEGKRAAENLLFDYVDEYKVKANIARLSCIYGPTMDREDSKAHAQFFRNALRGEDIVLKSDGKQQRIYTYVIDAVTGILCVLFRGKEGEIYNVCNSKSVASIRDVAEIVAAWAHRKVVYGEPSATERKGFSKPQDCLLNNDKLVELGWKEAYMIKDGIEETLCSLNESSL